MEKFQLYLNHKFDPVYFSLCECGYEKCSPDHSVGPLKREYYLFHFVISGEGTYKVDKTYNLSKGDVFLIKPGETIEYKSNPENPWFYYWIGFDSPKIKNLLSMLFGDSHVLHLDNVDWIKKIFLEINKCDSKSEISQFYITSKLYEIVYYLFKIKNLSINEMSEDVVSKIIVYITDHISEEINVNSICKHFGFSRSRLFSLFKDKMGISIKEYLTNTKLDRAWILLEQNHSLSIQEVSWLVGYTNYQSFFKAFKRKFDRTPASIRRS